MKEFIAILILIAVVTIGILSLTTDANCEIIYEEIIVEEIIVEEIIVEEITWENVEIATWDNWDLEEQDEQQEQNFWDKVLDFIVFW